MIDIVRAALVIARRDFTAIVFSRTFIFFLIGPLFPLLIGMAFGGLGEKISSDSLRPVIGLAMAAGDAGRMEGARAALVERVGERTFPELKRLPGGGDPAALLARRNVGVVAIVSGSIRHPVLTGKPDDIAMLEGDVSLIASAAELGAQLPRVTVTRRPVVTSTGAQDQARLLTARAGQALIFLLTMLLAGMVLSNMVEEKTTKVIEVLAAAVPVDAIFLGKLAAMLAMSFVGILFWTSGAVALTLALAGPGGLSALPPPAVGWPLFVLLGVLYFAMAYLLLGSLFLGIGAQAATVREVQTLNMPVTMAQLLIFFFASYAVDHMGSPAEVAAAIFPFSSPFAMIARAAQQEAIWPHVAALVWQGLAVVLIIRLGVFLFRRHVLKSGSGGGRLRWRDMFSRAKA
ncbi:MAG: ABC transporter permease [Sphingobium sp.]|nr:ABC transporter permease [Sphingobium sp.]